MIKIIPLQLLDERTVYVQANKLSAPQYRRGKDLTAQLRWALTGGRCTTLTTRP